MSDELKIRALRELARCKYPVGSIADVAARLKVSPEQVREMAQGHGWPDPGAMGRAADALERRNGGGRVGEIERLLGAAEQSYLGSTRKLGARIEELIERLKAALDGERESRAVLEEIEKLEQAIRAKKAELKILSEGKGIKKPPAVFTAGTGNGRRSNGPGKTRPTEEETRRNAEIRDWAREQGMECGTNGRIRQEVMEAWERRNVEADSVQDAAES